MSSYKKVFTGSSITVKLLSDLLNRQGIANIIKDHKESARLAGFGSYSENVELLVPKASLGQASDVIAKFQESANQLP